MRHVNLQFIIFYDTLTHEDEIQRRKLSENIGYTGDMEQVCSLKEGQLPKKILRMIT